MHKTHRFVVVVVVDAADAAGRRLERLRDVFRRLG